MNNIYIFLAIAFIFTFAVGKVMEKIRVPWIFAALIFGSIIAIQNPFQAVTNSETFKYLGELGMYFLLFIVGFELDLKSIKKEGNFIIKSTLIIILAEAFFGSILIAYIFHYNWLVSTMVALSFATVGEAILVPILDEFKAINTKVGQAIIGIGTLDDIFEIAILIGVSIMIGVQENNKIIGIILALLALVIITSISFKFKHQSERFAFKNIETSLLFTLFIFFLFLGIGKIADASALAALLAGVSVRIFLQKKRCKMIENEVHTLAYGLFAPIFFLWVGTTIDMQYLLKSPLIILLVIIITGGTKLITTYFIAHKKYGTKKSILLGIGLSIRFSTSIIIIKILLDNNIIKEDVYSVIIASSVIYVYLIPILFANLLHKWVKQDNTKHKLVKQT